MIQDKTLRHKTNTNDKRHYINNDIGQLIYLLINLLLLDCVFQQFFLHKTNFKGLKFSQFFLAKL